MNVADKSNQANSCKIQLYSATMTINLPEAIQAAVQPLFDAIPLDESMSQLVVTEPGPTDIVASIIALPALAELPSLQSGMWLYVDQLDRSHDISQNLKSPTGSFWHGIMHRREGDFGNSHYWFRNTGDHPAMDQIDGYDGHGFIDEVETAIRRGDDLASFQDMQRREWVALFEWCATQD